MASLKSILRSLRELSMLNAETAAYRELDDRGMRSSDIVALQAWSDFVMAHPGVVERWGHLPCTLTAVLRPTDNSGTPAEALIYLGTGDIEVLADNDCAVGTIMHELAHRVCASEHGIIVAHHGDEFIQSHLDLARIVLGEGFHDQLRQQYIDHEVIK